MRRPRPGTIARRLWNEASSSDRWQGRASGCALDPGAGSRIEVVRGVDGHGEHATSPSTRRRRWRQGIQLSAHTTMALKTRHRGGDSEPNESAIRADQSTQVPRAERGGTLHRLAEMVPPSRHAIREARAELHGHGHTRDDPAMQQAFGTVKQNVTVSLVG